MNNRDNKIKILYLLIILILIIIPLARNENNFIIKTNYNNRSLGTSVYLNWTKVIDENNGDEGRAIAIDLKNNIYITGKIFNISSGSYDVFLIKYDDSGNKLWQKSWGGNLDDYGRDIIINNSRDIYIVGATQSYGNGSFDICLLKYNNTGSLQWNITWGGTEWDEGYGLAIDSSNKIYITGYSESNDINGDMVLIKYDTSGIMEWNTSWGGIDNDLGYSLVIDTLDDIFITGYTSSYGSNGMNLMLAKFNRTGHLQWNKTWGGLLPDIGIDLVSDQLNNIYIIGSTESYGAKDYDIVLLKYNNSGDLQWNTTWSGNNYDYGYSIDLDSNNNIFIVGITKSLEDINGDICLIKFNNSANILWNKTWGGTLEDIGYSIVINSNDSIYITGQTKSYSDPTGDIFFTKLLPIPDEFILMCDADSPDPDGNITITWTKSLEAKNYTLYQFDKPITIINDTLDKVAVGNINRSVSLLLGVGLYYFIVAAFNHYGNMSSNVINVIVQYPPGSFKLSHNATDPDPDGCFELNWSISERAENYSIYSHDTFIKDIVNNGTLIAENVKFFNYSLSDLKTRDYYYIVVAYNKAGKNLSNCIQVSIGRTPLNFTINSDADNPDDDGRFFLYWTASNFSVNYTIYYYKSYISEYNDNLSEYNVLTPLPGNEKGPFQIYLDLNNWKNGTYYFAIVARNEYGEILSNCIIIELKIIKSKENNGSNDKIINPLELLPFILFGILLALLSIIAIIKKKKKRTIYTKRSR